MAEGRKNLDVSTGLCDARNVKEEVLAAYEHISISSGTVLTTSESRALMARYSVEISSGQIVDVPTSATFSMVNGSTRFTAAQSIPEEKRVLIVNGSLNIEEGSEAVLNSYASIMVNGSVNVPESMSGMLGTVTINGSTHVYPDGCIHLNKNEILDRTFALRAKQDACYYAAHSIAALVPDIDFAKMAAKNVRFITKKLIIAESLVEAAMPLFDEQAKIRIVPDGCVMPDEDQLLLNEGTMKRYGGKLIVNGDVSILETGPWFDALSFLWASGNVWAVRGAVGKLDAIGAKYDQLRIIGGTLLREMADVHITREMLENAADGLSLVSCGSVTFEDDIAPGLLKEKLVSIWECAAVFCSDEQKNVIVPLAHEVDFIGREEASEEPEEQQETPETANTIETVRISCGSYVL